MQAGAWMKEMKVSITVCGAGGAILEMNDQACRALPRMAEATWWGRVCWTATRSRRGAN